MKGPCEYYCPDCNQLRLWVIKDRAPTDCTNCGSEDIDVDHVDSPRLWNRRHPGEPMPATGQALVDQLESGAVVIEVESPYVH